MLVKLVLLRTKNTWSKRENLFLKIKTIHLVLSKFNKLGLTSAPMMVVQTLTEKRSLLWTDVCWMSM